MKAVGMFAGGISAYDSGKYTRRVMDTNRQNALNAGVMQRDRIRESARMAMGQQLVAQGGSGAGVGTGSALDALHASAINREMDLALSRAGASAQAGDYARKGFMAYQQGKAALSAGIISGAAEIASEVAGAMGGMPGIGGGGGGGNAFVGNGNVAAGNETASGGFLSSDQLNAPMSTSF
jgi:hypothetical protein